MSAHTDLHPRTLASIEAQPDSGDPRVSMRSCGCSQQPGGAWWLCGYHEGFEDALDMMDERVMEDWIGDAESIIHQHCGSDSSDDAQNDWVHDLANELWRHFGAGNAAASGIDALDVLNEHITRLIEAGDALYDRIAPATNMADAAQLEAWLAAVSAINERADR